MEEEGQMVMIRDKKALDTHLALWKDGEPADKKPIGYVLSIEGADSFITVNHMERAYAYGLRAVGPAHYGPGRYANGTDSTGHLNAMGKELLRTMDRLGMILDVTHLCDEAFWDALDLYKGPIWASHNNCRAFVDHNRQFSDEMIKALIERDAVIDDGTELGARRVYSKRHELWYGDYGEQYRSCLPIGRKCEPCGYRQ